MIGSSMSPRLVCLVVTTLACCAMGHLTVLSPPPNSLPPSFARFHELLGVQHLSPRMRAFTPEHFNVTGVVVPYGYSEEDATGCSELPVPMSSVYPFPFIVVVPFGACVPRTQVQRAKDTGAQALLMFETLSLNRTKIQSSFLATTWWYSQKLIDIPTAYIPGRAGFAMIEYAGTVLALQQMNVSLPLLVVNVTPDDNPYLAQMRVWGPLLAVVMVMLCLFSIAFGVYRYYGFYLDTGFQLSTAQVVLWLDFVGVLIRLIHWCAGANFITDHWGWIGEQVLISIYSPFTHSASLFIALYWLEIVTSMSAVSLTSLNRLALPFIGVFCALLGVELWVTISRATWDLNADDKNRISGIIYATVSWLVGVTFMVCGSVLLCRLRYFAKRRATVTRLTKLSLLVFACGTFHLTLGASALLGSFADVGGTDQGFAGVTAGAALSAAFIALTHVWSFTPHSQRTTSTKRSKSSPSDTQGRGSSMKRGLVPADDSRSNGDNGDGDDDDANYDAGMAQAFDKGVELQVVVEGVHL